MSENQEIISSIDGSVGRIHLNKPEALNSLSLGMCQTMLELQPRPWLLNLNKDTLETWDATTWDTHLQGSALRRIKPWMWRRNAAAAQPNPPSSL